MIEEEEKSLKQFKITLKNHCCWHFFVFLGNLQRERKEFGGKIKQFSWKKILRWKYVRARVNILHEWPERRKLISMAGKWVDREAAVECHLEFFALSEKLFVWIWVMKFSHFSFLAFWFIQFSYRWLMFRISPQLENSIRVFFFYRERSSAPSNFPFECVTSLRFHSVKLDSLPRKRNLKQFQDEISDICILFSQPFSLLRNLFSEPLIDLCRSSGNRVASSTGNKEIQISIICSSRSLDDSKGKKEVLVALTLLTSLHGNSELKLEIGDFPLIFLLLMFSKCSIWIIQMLFAKMKFNNQEEALSPPPKSQHSFIAWLLKPWRYLTCYFIDFSLSEDISAEVEQQQQ